MSDPHSAPGARARLDELSGRASRFLQRESQRPPLALDSGPLVRLLEISRAMNRIHDLEELLEYVTERLRELFNATNGFVILFEPQGEMRIHASSRSGRPGEELQVSETILRTVRESRKPVLIDDTAEVEELKHQQSIERYRIASVLCAPLVIGDQVIGALQFDHRGDPHPFPKEDLRLLELFADQAATAFNNMLLIERLNRARENVEVAQERVVQAERLSALGEMAAGMAHDFNNTLFVALGFCDVLLARESLETEVRGSIERIRTCSLDAANTVRRLQTFARGEGVDRRREAVDCRTVAAEMPEYTRHKWSTVAGRNNVAIEVRTQLGTTPLVRANPADIREVLTNLIFNAVDALELKGGEILIESGHEDGWVFLRVRDNGIGMDAETKRRVFEPFYTTKGARGSGFGLSVCWSIARRLGGTLGVESKLGVFSEFTLRLPVAEPGPPVEDEDAPAPSRSMHIAVVDDEPDVLETIARMIGSLGHRVETFSGPHVALARLGSTEGWDLVLTDLDLGVSSCTGFELARRLQAMRASLPVIVLTGWGSDGSSEPRPDNVRAILSKPITRDRLSAALAGIQTKD